MLGVRSYWMRIFMNRSNALVLITELDQYIRRYHQPKTD